MDMENQVPDGAAFQQLQEEHRQYCERLEGLSQNSYPSADVQMEEVRLKKLKLRVKDQMAGRRLTFHFS